MYSTNTFVTNEEDFLKEKNKGLKIGAINLFNGFLLELPKDPNLERYNFVVIWCDFFRNLLLPLNLETNLTFPLKNLL